MTSLLALTLSAILLGAPQDPQSPVQPLVPPETSVEDVVVEGRRDVRAAVSNFIAEVAAPPRGQGLAVWDRRVCVGTANLRREHAYYMIDRVSQVAAVVGLEPGEAGCRPDVMVIGTRDATAFATALVEDNLSAFRPALSDTDRGSAALRAFQQDDRAVRWWHVSLPVSRDTGQTAVALRGQDAPEVTVRGTSRLVSGIRQDLKRVIIIIDGDRLEGASFAHVADYVAMIALAQVDPDADVSGYGSALNLFDPAASHQGLTQWDVDYLKALYEAPVDRAITRHQTEAIAGAMTRERQGRD